MPCVDLPVGLNIGQVLGQVITFAWSGSGLVYLEIGAEYLIMGGQGALAVAD